MSDGVDHVHFHRHSIARGDQHVALEQAGIRFTEVVNEMRLAAAYAALTEQNNKSIALVALESGFSDIAHFNRLFRKRFGATPSAVRTLRLRENG